MSLYDYRQSLEISRKDPQFAALIMSAMRKADSTNIVLLRWAWPEISREFELRYHAPGGILPGDGPVCTCCDNPECEDCPASCPLHGKKPVEGDGVGSGACAVCQSETTCTGEHMGALAVWLCPDHGGLPHDLQPV